MGFFDNFGKMVSDTYKSAAKTSGKLVEEGKLRLMISDNESQMKDIFEVIGRDYCESFLRGELVDNGKYENEFEDLKRMQLENDQAREKILLLKRIRKCVKCDKEISIDHTFCQYCGEKQPEVVEETVEEDEKVEEVKEEEKVCDVCGAKLDSNDAFCPFCGKQM